jgi:hypothetical protein
MIGDRVARREKTLLIWRCLYNSRRAHGAGTSHLPADKKGDYRRAYSRVPVAIFHGLSLRVGRLEAQNNSI